MYEFILNISVCFILSILIGLERQYHHKMVGLRTNVLVALGAFLFVHLSYKEGLGGDQMRIASQVVTGIGFLGAGVILRDGSKIKGLNTAATLWCVAAIGVLTSSGMLLEATIGTGFVLISNLILRKISKTLYKKIKQEQREKCTLNITCTPELEILVRTRITENTEKNDLRMESLDINKLNKDEINLSFIFITTRKELIGKIVKNLSDEVGINKISWSHKKLPKHISEEYDDSNDEVL